MSEPHMPEEPTNNNDTLLQVEDLQVEFATYGGTVQAVRGVSFAVEAGKTLAIVGESGCGKSVTVQSIMGLTPMPPGRITKGAAYLRGHNILGQKTINGKDIRGDQIGMIFQDPMTSLNPTMNIGNQIAETLIVHRGYSKKQAFARAVELLELSKIPEADKRARQYPFEFSGGMLQRAMIAMAIACEPDILIADEPTTALDVTIQAQILDLLGDLQRETGMAIILITHDLGVVARMADDVLVMYAGQVVEHGSVDSIFYESAHPYTLGLRAAMPSNDPERNQELTPIDGSPPDLFQPPVGCGYAPRCPYAMKVCAAQPPAVHHIGPGHEARCWLHDPANTQAVPAIHNATQVAHHE
ncbi:MAG: ABC transporter ATP-binding protein [Pseudomonadota bacterium]